MADENPDRFTNHYHCTRCDTQWSDNWSCMCDDDCPKCGLTMTPIDSEENEPCD